MKTLSILILVIVALSIVSCGDYSPIDLAEHTPQWDKLTVDDKDYLGSLDITADEYESLYEVNQNEIMMMLEARDVAKVELIRVEVMAKIVNDINKVDTTEVEH